MQNNCNASTGQPVDGGSAVNNKVVRLNAKKEPVFAVLVVGCGGGPLEHNLSNYVIKAIRADVSEGFVALEGGSAVGALTRLVQNDIESLKDFYEIEPSTLSRRKAGVLDSQESGRIAAAIWENIKCFAITHSHADHIVGLVISSASSLSAKPLYGLASTLKNLSRVFDGGIWPRLAGWESDGIAAGRAYLYREIFLPCSTPLPLSSHLFLEAYPLSHGSISKSENYESTAFFISDSVSHSQFLFFGDVESDSISKTLLNRTIWERAAALIVAEKLDTIFLECSYPSTQPVDALWGHLSPPFVIEELKVLAQLVSGMRASSSALPLQDVTVVIIHIKDDVLPSPLPPAPEVPEWHTAPTSPRFSLSMSPPFPTINLKRRASGDPALLARHLDRRASCPDYPLPYYHHNTNESSRRELGERTGNWKPTVLETSDEDGFSEAQGRTTSEREIFSIGDPGADQSVKEEREGEENVQERIGRELNELERKERTGVTFVIASQGMVLS